MPQENKKWPFPTTAKATDDLLPSFPCSRAQGWKTDSTHTWVMGTHRHIGQWDTQRDLHTQKALQLSKGKGPPCSRVPPTRSLARRHCPGQHRWHLNKVDTEQETSPAWTAQGWWALTKSAQLQAAKQLSRLRCQDICCCILALLHPLWGSAWKLKVGKI